MITEPLREAATLDEALRLLAKEYPRAGTCYPGTGDWLYACDLDARATGFAIHLRRNGVGPGDLVGLIHDTGPEFLVCLFGILRTGAAATVLPVLSRSAGTARVTEAIGGIIDAAEIRHVVTDARSEQMGDDLAARRPRLTALRLRNDTADEHLPHLHPCDLAVVQFTSGTTSRPRGVMLSHRAVLAGLRAIVVSAEFTTDDVLVQWVPTYHDMGLFGLLSQLLNATPVHVFTPMAFLRDPAVLLRHATEHGGTVISGPNFGYDAMAETVARRGRDGLALGGLRLAFNGSEPVRATTVERWQQAVIGTGLRPHVMYPVYGMAEATLAVAFPVPGSPLRVVHADRGLLAEGDTVRLCPAGSSESKALVSVGRPVHGLELRIADRSGRTVEQRTVGEIQLRGEALTSGYYRDPDAGRDLFDGPWLRTGDLGVLLEGDLFITGRRKEMVIVHGRNYFPEDAEEVASRIPGVHRGRCVAFRIDEENGEAMGLAIETRMPEADHGELTRVVSRRVGEALGLSEVVVHAVPPNWVTRTTSGKPQRLLARRRLYGPGPASAPEVQ